MVSLGIVCLYIYKVDWVVVGGGPYVPADPVAGGDYNSDLYGSDLITAADAKTAKKAVELGRPKSKVKRPRKLCQV